MHHVLLLGAGFAGLTVAQRLDQFLEANPQHRATVNVTLVDRASAFSIGASYQYVVTGEMKPSQGTVPYSALKLSHVRFLQADITRIAIPEKRVFVRLASDGEGSAPTELPYDELVLALGIHLDPAALPGVPVPGTDPHVFNICTGSDAPRLRDALQTFTGGTIIVSVPQIPFKCPPAPGEYACIIDTVLAKRDPALRERTKIIYTNPMQAPPPPTPAVSPKLLALYNSRGVEFRPLSQVTRVDTAEKKIHLSGRIADDPPLAPSKGPLEPLSYDLLILHGPLRPPAVLKTPGLDTNPMGYVNADLRTLRTSAPGVYACGDSANLASRPAPKAGVFAASQAEVISASLIAGIENPAVRADWGTAPVAGWRESACLAETGRGEAVRISVDWVNAPGPVFGITESEPKYYHEKIAWVGEVLDNWFDRSGKA